MASAPGTEDDRLILPEDVLTGEAVALALRPASFATRLLALVVDLIAMGLLLLVLALASVVGLIRFDEAGAAALGLVVSVAGMIGYPVVFETLTRGRSLGKLLMGLRVVREDGGPIRFRQALIRALVSVFEIWFTFGSVALIASLVTPRGQRLGDLMAGTFVVRERAGYRPPPLRPMPPQLAVWAAGADLAPLPDALALAVRQFLGRAGRLAPDSRVRLAAGLADDVARFVAPSAPSGTDPESFLTAVMAERRTRDLDRLRRRDAARRARQARLRDASPLTATGGLVESPER